MSCSHCAHCRNRVEGVSKVFDLRVDQVDLQALAQSGKTITYIHRNFIRVDF